MVYILFASDSSICNRLAIW